MQTLARTSLHALGLAFGLAASTLSTAGAVPVYNETEIHDTTTTVEVALNADTVLCSAADYGALFLKILIPDLAKLTLLDHQNTGAGAPCVAAGSCAPGRMPSDIIDAAHPNENVSINVKAIRGDESDVDAQTCSTYLIEKVKVTIRGVDFFHERQVALGSRAYADCVSSTVAPEPEPEPEQPATPDPVDPDDKTDKPGTVEDPSGGGCSTTGGGTGGSLAFLLFGSMVAVTRRRRSR